MFNVMCVFLKISILYFGENDVCVPSFRPLVSERLQGLGSLLMLMDKW